VNEPRKTPERGADQIAADGVTLERGFVASLRWLVAEGDARGVRRIAVELRALREALTTLDETRSARDESAKRATELEREVSSAIAMLGPGTSVNGNGSLVQRLTRLRERIKEDSETRRQLVVERDAWRSMTTLMTQTRAYVHELLEGAERGRDGMSTEIRTLRDQVLELQIAREHAEQEKRVSEETLHALRERLQGWSGTVERALAELNKTASEIVNEHATVHPADVIAGFADARESTESVAARATSGAAAAEKAPSRRIRRTYVALNSREQFHKTRRPLRQAVWLLLPSPTVAEWRHLYGTIGREWNWHDRDRWSDRQIGDRLARAEVHIFRADAALNALADDIEHGVGFVELERHPNGSVEIVYFGLTKSAQGFGLGSWMLERAVEEAWGLGATRVWLHTCTEDSPHALPNYIARGFEVEREEEYDAP
jgi:GNAT superfamily N-acetyltransferase/mRNA-degrading endonuclease toxin of MazEF toxin-antitoxin module